MTLYVTRHGQTEWNSEERVCGTSDIKLTDKGVTQAAELAMKLGDYKIDMVLSSPLNRARTTAEILAKQWGGEVVLDSRLSEQNYGIYEGVSRSDEGFKYAKKQFPGKMLGGESVFRVVQRVYNLLDDINNGHHSNVLIVAHGSVCRVIHSYFNDLSNEEYSAYYIRNCELKEYHF
ncbi:hypothetical protein BC351_39050 [Paenibacillus ferrarius]|uniref:phosphoglycerate mutase (2,3-diphosphoglycerate-dependent) n=1 Tax=Paenibacillus ferrarius TaxID=1469647 RepID=A0A1V4H9J5_9BACL|nr:histidine phosphatase family protein [Paenibacillus ferrarius]OPH47988.1 hypothetical protein BC351_39050 [Paenibacillus ferrarius]